MIMNNVTPADEHSIVEEIATRNANGWSLRAVVRRTGVGTGPDRFWCFWQKDDEQ